MATEKEHKRFLMRFLILCAAPLVFIVSLNFLIDPFNHNNLFDIGLKKDKVSQIANSRLYKLIAFERDPVPNILLGDSRLFFLDTHAIEKESGQRFFNFAYGGGTLNESTDTFWRASKQVKLRSVYIGINFNLFNKNNSMNLVPEMEALSHNPAKYYSSLYIAKISLFNLIYRFTGWNFAYPKLKKKQELWKDQLGPATDGFYSRYTYPETYVRELKKIKAYCDRNGVELVFLIPPTHVDLQNKAREYKLEKQFEDYKKVLASISTTVDYDFPNEWTKNRALFRDPYHANARVISLIIREVWGDRLRVGRVVAP